MSGIVGLFQPDGAPVDQSLARALTRFLSFRGPDGRDTWCGESIALGHAMLRTTEESAHERQPAALHGRFWITADARLDARDELRDALRQAGREPARNAPDSELILQAYAAWGEESLERLRGDFAFGIWDAQRRSLFCARDHFGIKPFYFAEHKDFFLFSNTLNCVRMHPEVSDELNEAAIADFLLFGLNCDPATTTFRAIRRLPPAHFLRVSAEGLRIGRYWSIPVDGGIRYSREEEYVEQFQALLRKAVSDRLRGERVGIFLSGGLDSSSVAATARELAPERGEAGKLRAYTISYGTSIPDPDPPYARELATLLEMPIRFISMERVGLFEEWDKIGAQLAEPVNEPLMAGLFLQFQAIAKDCAVALDCEGADNIMRFQIIPHVRGLLLRGQWKQLLAVVPFYLRRRSLWDTALRRARRLVSARPDAPKFPEWLEPAFARRIAADERWQEFRAFWAVPAHPVMPIAQASLSLPQWQRLFELQSPGITGLPVEVRYPFLDLRIVEYVLAIPPFPWTFQKTLLREAMAGRLPERIRRRPKTPLEHDPAIAALKRAGPKWDRDVEWSRKTDVFVNRSAVRKARWEDGSDAAEIAMVPLCLNFWLRYSRSVRYNLATEVHNG
ncbi:MAG: asparagine synthetase B [Acidobacteriota bacterium]|nr:asparagine synthetase B [Acidobacteriota bacterium]